MQFTLLVVNHVDWVKSIATNESQLELPKVNWNFNFFFKKLGFLHRYTLFSNHNVHKSSCGLCFWAPHPLIGPGTHEQSPNELLWTLPFDEMFNSKGCMTPKIHSYNFSSFSFWTTTKTNRNSYLFSKLYSNFGVCNWLLMFAIDFWRFQLSLLKAHDSLQQSELENLCKKFLENFSNWLAVSNWL